MKMFCSTRMSEPGDNRWRHFNQTRDCTENDNMSPQEEMRFAADLERWAASRANDPGFAPFCFAATREAQQMRRRNAPRSA